MLVGGTPVAVGVGVGVFVGGTPVGVGVGVTVGIGDVPVQSNPVLQFPKTLSLDWSIPSVPSNICGTPLIFCMHCLYINGPVVNARNVLVPKQSL